MSLKSLNESVYGLLRKEQLTEVIFLTELKKEWEFIVGKQLGKKTNPIKIVRGTLFVKTPHQAYASIISFKKTDILAYIRVTMQNDLVKDLKFTHS